MRERGQLVRKGTLGEDGDIEFWEDGSVTVREREEEVEAKEKVVDDSPPGASFKVAKVGEKKAEE